ncbi:hypothetical protein EG329_003004 [Mollisiaceae sp. DMI_Dod_QoI]|nr:hypothetical protein EG329_003004 [Helotiales sp. DMI_Dod_QoI]
MRLSFFALAAAAVSVQAFKDTSPFILFSSSPLPASFQDVSTYQLQSKSVVIDSAKKFLSSCPSEIYYVVSQPGVSFTDLSSSAVHLKKALSNPGVQARYTIGEVVGLNATDADELEAYIQNQCGAKKADVSNVASALKQRTGTQGSSVIVREKYPEITSTVADRANMVVDADSTLYPVLSELPKGYKYTFIYTTSPAVLREAYDNDLPRYEATFDEVVHMDLKRDLQARKDGEKTPDQRPLFEKYQYFNPGLFMGLLVGLLLISILGVGMSALGSLQVSYGAFDKEMGPAAQKKQQ